MLCGLWRPCFLESLGIPARHPACVLAFSLNTCTVGNHFRHLRVGRSLRLSFMEWPLWLCSLVLHYLLRSQFCTVIIVKKLRFRFFCRLSSHSSAKCTSKSTVLLVQNQAPWSPCSPWCSLIHLGPQFPESGYTKWTKQDQDGPGVEQGYQQDHGAGWWTRSVQDHLGLLKHIFIMLLISDLSLLPALVSSRGSVTAKHSSAWPLRPEPYLYSHLDSWTPSSPSATPPPNNGSTWPTQP